MDAGAIVDRFKLLSEGVTLCSGLVSLAPSCIALADGPLHPCREHLPIILGFLELDL